MKSAEELNAISKAVIGCVIEVHKSLGPGLLESAYQQCLSWELRQAGFAVLEQISVSIQYKALVIADAYRIDILVEDEIILELKSVERLEPVHLAQILTYMKARNSRLGFLLNFNVDSMRKGIKRVVNKL